MIGFTFSIGSAPRHVTKSLRLGALTLGLASGLTGLGALTAAPAAAANTCFMQIEASGAYRGALKPGSGEEVNFEPSYPRSLRIKVARNKRFCNEQPNSLGNEETNGNFKKEIMYQVLTLVSGKAHNEAHSSRGKPQDRAALLEFRTWTNKQAISIVKTESIIIAIDTVVKVLEKTIFAEISLPAKTALDLAKETVKEYLRGGNGDDLKRAILRQIPKAAKDGMSDDQWKKIVGYADQIANKTYVLMTDTLGKNVQTLNATADGGECDYSMNATLSPIDRKYAVVFTKVCNGSVKDLNTVALDLTKEVEPGQNVTGRVSAFDLLGAPLSITGVTGIQNSLLPKERATFAWTAQPAIGPWTFQFTVADPRRDERFGVTGTVVTKTGSKIARADYKVKNVAPTLEITSGGEAKADPDEKLELNLVVKVTDKNADDQNKDEVKLKNTTLGDHPPPLDTEKKFNDFDDRSGALPDDKGVYTFTLKRSATVKGPHEWETYVTEVCAKDEALKDCADVKLTVNNVAPKILLSFAMPSSVFAHDPTTKLIDIKIKVQDRNKAGDINSVEVDATSPGGEVYTLAKGLKEVASSEDSITYQLTKKFSHNDVIKLHNLPVKVEDWGEPAKTAAGKATLEIKSDVPEIHGTGLLIGFDSTLHPPKKHLCPGELYRFGVIVDHRAGQTVKVTATVIPGGGPVNMNRADGKNFIGTIAAPAAPGEYRVTFNVRDAAKGGKAAAPQSLSFTVKDCRPTTGGEIALAPNAEPKNLLGALAAARAGLAGRPQQGYVALPYGHDDVPSALEAAQGALADRKHDLARAALLDRKRDRKRDHNNWQGGQENTAGNAPETVTGPDQETATSDPAPSNGASQGGAIAAANLGAFADALGRYAGDGGCGFDSLTLANSNGLVLQQPGGSVPLSVAGPQASGQNVTLFGVANHRLSIRLQGGGLALQGNHPGGASCNSFFERLG